MLFAAILALLAVSRAQTVPAHFESDAAAVYQRAAQVTPPAGADVIVLEEEESTVFDADGKAVHTRYWLYKILTQRGAEGWAEVSINWDPWRADKPSIRARVITPDGAVHPLDEKTLTDAPEKDHEENVFSDRRVMRAPLPAVAPGSLIEEELVFNDRPAFAGAGSLRRVYFGTSAPTQHVRVVLDAPASLPLRYELQLLPDVKPQRVEADGRVRITFEAGPLPPEEQPDADLARDVPAYANLLVSSGNSWKQQAEEYSKIVDKQLADSDLKALVAKAVGKSVGRDEKISALMQFLGREVRYTGVEFGDASVVPRPPSETLTRKYGDCKDKSALLVAMLRTAGIPAYVALLNAGERQDVSADLPGMGLFDHAIVYIPGPPAVWIDATDEYARLGQMPTADQDRFALIARSGTEALVRTPMTSSVDNLVEEKREIFLAENGPAKIVETTHPHGSAESPYRHAYADKENKSAKESLTNYVKEQYIADRLDRMEHSESGDLSRQFELVLASDKARRGFTELNSAAAAIRMEGIFNRLPADLRERAKEDDPKAKQEKDDNDKPKKKRINDYELRDAFVTEWQYNIVLPAGFRPKPLPQNASLTLGPALLTEEFSADKDNVVHARLRFDMVKKRITASEGAELRKKIVEIDEGAPIVIYFEPAGEALFNQGKVAEALQSYRDLIALHPKEAVHHLQLAQILLAAGLGEGARNEARAAVKLEPKSVLAERTLAEILEYDSVGRRLRPGSDFAGAEAAYRAAMQLEPEDDELPANLAILLEYDKWGLRYGPTARLKDAITEYRKVTPQRLVQLGVGNNLAYTLFYAGEFAEAQKLGQTLNPVPIALVVASEAALNGSQAGLSEARKRTASDAQFKESVKAAGQMLVNLRKYAAGADLQDAGASGSDASETAAFAALYRKSQPHEQMKFGDDPGGVSLRYEMLTSNPDLTLEQFRAICSRNGKIGLATPDILERLTKEEKEMLSRKARDGEFPEVGLDLLVTRAQPKAQGSDDLGYKVTLFPSASYKSATYVVKEDGGYRILGTLRYPPGVALQALDRLAANDLPGARRWLDWVREDWHLASDDADDPISSGAFPHLWIKGREADATTIKLAAASVLTTYKQTAAQGLAILEAARAGARNETELGNILMGMLFGYNLLEQYEKALEVDLALLKLFPDSKRILRDEFVELRQLRRFDQDDKVTAERLKQAPDDLDAMREQIFVAVDQGDHAKAHALCLKMIEEGRAEVGDLNNAAWQALFIGKVDASDLENALKGAQLSRNSPNILHTLGSVYAEVGKTKEAREVLIQAMDKLDLDEPDENYWYAFGRIAEQYGERAIAQANYARVTKPKSAIDLPDSTYTLAQMRLQAMGKGK